MHSPLLTETQKSQLTAEHLLTERHGNLAKKIPTTKDKEVTTRLLKGYNHNKTKSHTCWVETYRLESNYTTEALPQE